MVGGGDSHLLVASSVISLSRAASFQDFIAEVKDGQAVPFVTPDYFAPLNWKLFLRVAVFHVALPADCQLQGTAGGRLCWKPASAAGSGGSGQPRFSVVGFGSGIGALIQRGEISGQIRKRLAAVRERVEVFARAGQHEFEIPGARVRR